MGNHHHSPYPPPTPVSHTRNHLLSNSLKITAFLFLLIFYGTFLVHKIELPVADDLPRHLQNGALLLQGHTEILYRNVYSYTHALYPFVNHHWLFGVIAYLLYHIGGWNLIIITKTVLFLLLFALLFYIAKKQAHFWIVAYASIPTIMMLSQRTTFRPELFSYLCIALFLYFLMDLKNHPEHNRIYWLLPIQFFWVNSHIFFPIGIMLVAGFFFEEVLKNGKTYMNSPMLKKTCFLLLFLPVICLLNPNGLKGLLQPFTIFQKYGMPVSENLSILEFFQTNLLHDYLPIMIFIVIVIPLFLSFIWSYKTKPILYILCTVTTALAGFFMIRNIPLFVCIFLPVCAYNSHYIVDSLRQKKYCFHQKKPIASSSLYFFLSSSRLSYLVHLV